MDGLGCLSYFNICMRSSPCETVGYINTTMGPVTRLRLSLLAVLKPIALHVIFHHMKKYVMK